MGKESKPPTGEVKKAEAMMTDEYKRMSAVRSGEIKASQILQKTRAGNETAGFVDIGESELVEITSGIAINKRLIAKLRPANSCFSKKEWRLIAPMMGITKAWSKDFQEYDQKFSKEHKHPDIGPDEQNPGKFWGYMYGALGEEAYKISGGETVMDIVKIIQSTEWRWSLDKLGLFGKWMKEARLDPRFAKAALLEYLQD